MSRILLAAATICALANAALAAEVRLGPETAVTPVGPLGPAANDQDGPAVASNGHDFLAVWRDSRREVPNGRSDIYTSRIGRDGQPADAGGRRIAEGVYGPPVIASNGSEYLVCYQATTVHTFAQRLDENGMPIAPPTDLGASGLPIFLSSNGSGYLLILAMPTESSSQSIASLLLDRAGSPQGTVMTSAVKPRAVGVRNGSYIVVDFVEEYQSLLPRFHMITASGGVTDQLLPPISSANSDSVTAAISPDEILIAWWQQNGSGTGDYLLTDFDGKTIHPQTAIFNPLLTGFPVAAWDGHEFLVAFTWYTTVAFRIATDGTVLDSRSITDTYNDGSIAFASADTVQIAVWPERILAETDIVGQTFTSFDTFVLTADQANLITWSGSSQTDIQIARSGSHEIAAWSDRYDRILASVNGVRLSIAPSRPTYVLPGNGVSLPAVAGSNTEFLIAWCEMATDGLARVLSERVAFDGQVLDPSPIVIWTSSVPWTFIRRKPAITSDGSTFLMSWSTWQTSTPGVFTARVADDGTVRNLSSVPIELGAPFTFALADWPNTVWTGNRFLLSYALVRNSGCDIQCSLPAGIGGLPLDRDPQLLPPTPSMLFGSVESDGLGDVRPAVAAGAGRVTFVWSGSGYRLGVAQTNTDGTPLGEPRTALLFSPPGCAEMPAIGWDGAEFVVAWTDMCSAVVRAVRLNQFGDPIEDPFDVAADVLLEISGDVLLNGPSIIPTSDGVNIVYVRADEANAGAPRAFERSLARLPPVPPRRRSAAQ